MLRLFRKVFSSPRWVYAAQSLRGARNENQDNYLLLKPDGEATCLRDERPFPARAADWRQDFFRLAVADGMGGHRHGREVAEDLVQALLRLPAQTQSARLRDELYAIHKTLWDNYYTQGQPNPGATLVLADINKFTGRVLLANVGDSRAVAWRDGTFQPLTRDHTSREFDWREAAAKDPALPELETTKTNRIMQAMGFGSHGLIPDETGYRPRQLNARLRLDLPDDLPENARRHQDIFTFYLNKGEALLLATDGLWSGEAFEWPAPDASRP